LTAVLPQPGNHWKSEKLTSSEKGGAAFMTINILIALDDSENAMRGVQHVAGNFTPDHKVTLFSVIPDTETLCQMNSKELTPYFKSQQTAFCSLENKKKEIMEAAQEKAKHMLINSGFRQENITLKIGLKKKGIARDIVAEANQGYDLIVIGRRGLSGIKEFLLGSISQKVLNLSRDVSLSIVN
jgi:nucleotide-binding universal stress UspA family protein